MDKLAQSQSNVKDIKIEISTTLTKLCGIKYLDQNSQWISIQEDDEDTITLSDMSLQYQFEYRDVPPRPRYPRLLNLRDQVKLIIKITNKLSNVLAQMIELNKIQMDIKLKNNLAKILQNEEKIYLKQIKKATGQVLVKKKLSEHRHVSVNLYRIDE